MVYLNMKCFFNKNDIKLFYKYLDKSNVME